MDWEQVCTGCSWCCWVTNLVTHSLFLAARVWVSIPLDRTGDKSWLVSTNNDNPFLITSNWFRVFGGPHSRQVKEISWAGYFWKRFLQSFKESCQVKWDPVQRFLAWLCLSTMVIICEWQSRKTGRTWDLDDALSHWTSQLCSHSISGLFLLWKTEL